MDENLQAQLQAIRQNYQEQLPAKIIAIQESWQELLAKWDSQTLSTLRLAVHSLVGSSGTFNFTKILDTTQAMEDILQGMEDDQSPDKHQRQKFAEQLSVLRELVAELSLGKQSQPKPSVQPKLQKQKGKLIFLVEDDAYQAQQLALQLKQAGYRIKIFSQLEEIKTPLPATADAIIIDMFLPDGQGTEVAAQIQQLQQSIIPMIFISARDDLATRLHALRAGGHAYFAKPIDVEALLNKLQQLTKDQGTSSYRVMIIEDDSATANHHEAILKSVDMQTHIVTNPMQVMEPLAQFKPDLILMDMHMPSCSGLELTAIIRQEERYAKIPIVFLSGETRPDQQLKAMIMGGDGFLTKPISASYLLASVANHIRRSREALRVEEAKRKKAERERSSLQGKIRSLHREVENVRQVYIEGELKPGTILESNHGENYGIKDILGRGGMGITYSAVRKSDLEPVVVKMMLKEDLRNAKLLMRFEQEARLILTLQHPNLVRGYNFSKGANFSYLVMEFIEGHSIEQLIDEHGEIEPVFATKIVLGIARALAYLERNHLVHRDIKPENIIIDKNSVPKLVDFGIAKKTLDNGSMTTEGIVLGSPQYISPEQICAEPVDTRSDIYCLGATYFHMIMGAPPFVAPTVTQVLQKRLLEFPGLQDEKPDLPRAVAQVIEKMMALLPINRHNNAEALVQELELVCQKIGSAKA